jgi:NADH:ubiquinone oxidoreductase subunit K
VIDFLAAHAPGLVHWLALSAVMFSIGIFGLLTRRNAVGVLMAVELMLNAAALNFVAFNRFVAPAAVDGQVLAIFVIAVAAAEAVVGMAVFVAIFKHRKNVDVTQMTTMHDVLRSLPPLDAPQMNFLDE